MRHFFSRRITVVLIITVLLAVTLGVVSGLTDMRIGEIVEHCGFSDSSNFSRTFRAVTGLSPSEFRKQYYK